MFCLAATHTEQHIPHHTAHTPHVMRGTHPPPGTDEAGAGSGACGVGEGVVVSIASQRSRAGVRREWEWSMGGHTEGNDSGPSLFHNPNNCALHHFHPVVWEWPGRSASPGGKGVEQ